MNAVAIGFRRELSTLYALFLRSMRASFTYKPALVMSLVGYAFAFLIPMLVWRHVYAEKPHQALSGEQLFPYLIIAGCVNFCLAANVEARISHRIRMGLIATDLLRPVDFQLAQLAQALSDGTFNLSLMLPVFGLAAVSWGRAALPHGAAALAAFCASSLLAFVILFAVSFIFVQASFITYSGYGVFVARNAMQQTFSGLSAPLVLFPPALRSVSEWLPFRHTIHTPAAIYLGWISGDAIWPALGAQLLWALGLLFVGRALLDFSLRRFEIQGG